MLLRRHTEVDWKPLKCAPGEGRRKSVGRTRRQMRKFYTWSKKIDFNHNMAS